jgi:ABC-2 type transport system ATP-binding protein
MTQGDSSIRAGGAKTAGSPLAATGDRAAPALECRGLVKTFGPIRAVDGIDLALPAGRIYGLLGPNGSGKTTLIRLLMGLARPTAGEARLLGVRMPSRAMLERIGYMTQADGIYPELSAWENLRFFAALYGARDEAKLMATLELVELADRRGTPAFQLSGGMRRRLSLACALAHDPPVVILDEPTVGIDPALRVQFWAHFRALAAAGTTVLVSSHVMDEADRCDELLFMRAGRVIARGSGADVRAQAGTENLEEAFLRFAEAAGAGGDDPPPRGRTRGHRS